MQEKAWGGRTMARLRQQKSEALPQVVVDAEMRLRLHVRPGLQPTGPLGLTAPSALRVSPLQQKRARRVGSRPHPKVDALQHACSVSQARVKALQQRQRLQLAACSSNAGRRCVSMHLHHELVQASLDAAYSEAAVQLAQQKMADAMLAVPAVSAAVARQPRNNSRGSSRGTTAVQGVTRPVAELIERGGSHAQPAASAVSFPVKFVESTDLLEETDLTRCRQSHSNHIVLT